MSSVAKWMGAREEPLYIAIKGDVAPWVWPRGWFFQLVLNPCVKPDRSLSERLHGPDITAIRKITGITIEPRESFRAKPKGR